jgi:hypothetical protein
VCWFHPLPLLVAVLEVVLRSLRSLSPPRLSTGPGSFPGKGGGPRSLFGDTSNNSKYVGAGLYDRVEVEVFSVEELRQYHEAQLNPSRDGSHNNSASSLPSSGGGGGGRSHSRQGSSSSGADERVTMTVRLAEDGRLSLVPATSTSTTMTRSASHRARLCPAGMICLRPHPAPCSTARLNRPSRSPMHR